MNIIIPEKIELEDEENATDLASCIKLVNSLKNKINDLTLQCNLLFQELEAENDYY